MVQQIKNEDDLKAVTESAGNKLLIIDFYATWCGPCKNIAPVLEKLAQELSDKLVLVKVDVDDEAIQVLVQQYNVTSMPTFVFLKNGKKVEQFAGANEARIRDIISAHT